MKTREDIRLEFKVSNMILELVDQTMQGDLNDTPHSDIQGICEALAMNIIKTVKGQ